MRSSFTVRRASPQEIDKLLSIEQSCAEAPHWNEQMWKLFLSEGEDRESARVCFVADTGQAPVGFIVVHHTVDRTEIENVAVEESARRLGIGKHLCATAIAWSRARSAQRIDLEARAASGGAIALYRSLGFEEQGRRRGYYQDPTDDAVLMSLPLRP